MRLFVRIKLTQPAPVLLGLHAVILAVTDGQPRVLTVERSERELLLDTDPSADAIDPAEPNVHAVPFAWLDPEGDRTLELGVRARVLEQTGLALGYVEQLYTFGDRNRLALEGTQQPRVVSVAYLSLTQEEPAAYEDARWRDCYAYFPWEDWRKGRPALIETHIFPILSLWIKSSRTRAQRDERRERAAITFGFDVPGWDGERVLERYELLYELGLVEERHRDERLGVLTGVESIPSFQRENEGERLGLPMALDHRRILSTALGRIRGKIKYRPVVFELVPERFTLFQLQRVVESLAGVPLHKQNFRRLVEKGGLVEGTGVLDTQTGGRPAELFSFRRDVWRERPAPGVGLPGKSSRTSGHS